ncbi:hypothetical protein QBC32DRAFT_379248 [Pseudoneurospora amorphoporcata]|uniref:Tyrosinase copper-binding domain-containing protein n=1 Tax=Pseudoneurospora amorphoporcata TaxID=241081 RepID=A0AAN6NNL9_9PEZI|nr:hypothetical protein QBC32DRAFT_379248 [Pseudoneurospora amorphoporcata]
MFNSLQIAYREWLRKPRYTPVVDDTESQTSCTASSSESGAEGEKPVEATSLKHHLLTAYLIITTLAWISLVIRFILLPFFLPDYYAQPPPPLRIWQQWQQTTSSNNNPSNYSKACKHPATRREWRSLTSTERSEFVDAIHCLARTPSQWGPNRTIYDDFSILHGGVGSWCHRSASFLPWHRWTLHIFENILKDKCGFPREATIPYWDWSLDHQSLASSSIFSPLTGFGSDGSSPSSPSPPSSGSPSPPSSPSSGSPSSMSTALPSVGQGHCVLNGPFADLRPIIYNHTYVTHCLSRGFNDPKRPNVTGVISGDHYKPEAIGEILRTDDYKEFAKRVEERLHNGLHQGVGGDFRAMTAANDPLFYVHHASLDRMWWRWQWEIPEVRLTEYNGKHMFNSTPGEASLKDVLLYGGFTDDVLVERAMSTESGELCYRYQ